MPAYQFMNKRIGGFVPSIYEVGRQSLYMTASQHTQFVHQRLAAIDEEARMGDAEMLPVSDMVLMPPPLTRTDTVDVNLHMFRHKPNLQDEERPLKKRR